MTPKQERFIAEYLIDLNATQAAARAGYSAKTAYSIGEELLRKPEIAEAVKAGQDARAERTTIDQDWVLTRLATVVERCLQAERVTARGGEPMLVETPSGEMAPAYTFNAAGANGALNLVGKHLGMFGDKLDVNFNSALADRLMQAMSRAKAE